MQGSALKKSRPGSAVFCRCKPFLRPGCDFGGNFRSGAQIPDIVQAAKTKAVVQIRIHAFQEPAHGPDCAFKKLFAPGTAAGHQGENRRLAYSCLPCLPKSLSPIDKSLEMRRQGIKIDRRGKKRQGGIFQRVKNLPAVVQRIQGAAMRKGRAGPAILAGHDPFFAQGNFPACKIPRSCPEKVRQGIAYAACPG